jgi:succinate dehydrogenase / fumarate reductase, cytochrome b subunit
MSANAVILPPGSLRFWQTTVGKKAVMATTGIIMFGFVIGHLVGNLQVFQGPAKLDHYAVFLRSLGPALWGVRIVLLLSLILHVWASAQLWMLHREARPVQYVKKANINSTYASRTMYWSGPIVLAFVIYHLLNFTFGNVHPGGPFVEGQVYNNLVSSFQVWPVSIFYIIAMGLLCIHLYHGLWSMFQSLGFNHPVYMPWIQVLAKLIAIVIAIGYISIPVAVLAGIIKPAVHQASLGGLFLWN